MDSKALKKLRKLRRLTQKDMAKVIGKTVQMYAIKENKSGFTDPEKLLLTAHLDLTFDQFNQIFYDGKLPFEQMWGYMDGQ